MSNEIKAEAVMEFVDMMVAAFESGFVDINNPTLSQIYQVARNHCKDSHGVETKNIVQKWGTLTAVECGLNKHVANNLDGDSKR